MSPPTSERARHEPVYLDDLEAGRARRPPLPNSTTSPDMKRKHRRRYEDEAPKPRRANTYREPPRRHPSYDDDGSPPPRRHRQREPRSRDYDDDYPPAGRPPRHHGGRDRHEDDYFSDNRHDRRRDPYPDDRRSRRHRDDERGERNSSKTAAKAPAKEGPWWQKEAKNMFKEYAVPAIKAEGGKLITKEIANLLAKR